MQGRGTLHFHCLLWLKNVISDEDFKLLLEDPEFKRTFISYLDEVICTQYPKDLKDVGTIPNVLTKLVDDPTSPGCFHQPVLNI